MYSTLKTVGVMNSNPYIKLIISPVVLKRVLKGGTSIVAFLFVNCVSCLSCCHICSLQPCVQLPGKG